MIVAYTVKNQKGERSSRKIEKRKEMLVSPISAKRERDPVSVRGATHDLIGGIEPRFHLPCKGKRELREGKAYP